MKIILVVFALVLGSVAAEAATYRFSFVSETLTPTEECVPGFTGGLTCRPGGTISVQLVFSLPDLVSRRIEFLAYPAERRGDPDTYVRRANYPFLFSGWKFSNRNWYTPYIGENGFISTDANGNLVGIQYSALDDTPDVCASLTKVSWGDSRCDWYEAPGKWTVSEVPLPTGGALLLTAVAAMGVAGRRRAFALADPGGAR
jgi:hypothetical protein